MFDDDNVRSRVKKRRSEEERGDELMRRDVVACDRECLGRLLQKPRGNPEILPPDLADGDTVVGGSGLVNSFLSVVKTGNGP